MKRSSITVVTLLLSVAASWGAPAVLGQTVSSEAALSEVRQQGLLPSSYLKASNTGTAVNGLFGDQFGLAVDISGNTLVVGAPYEESAALGVDGDESDNSASQSGAAYVFFHDGASWTQQAYLKASNTGAGDLFGTSVAISGDTIIVGAHLEDSSANVVDGDGANDDFADSGAAYVFVRNGTTWTQQAYLKPYNTNAGHEFGEAVGIDGNWAVVGSRFDGFLAGKAHVFRRIGTTWSQAAVLTASNAQGGLVFGDSFGDSVDISGNSIVVGASFEQSAATGVDGDQTDNSVDNSGAAYVFVRSGTVWTQQAYLKASNTDLGDFFGEAVAIDGDIVVVGAVDEDGGGIGVDPVNSSGGFQSGAAYIYERNGSTWTFAAYLKATNSDNSDAFGTDVDVSGNTVIVSAPREDSGATGFNGDEANGSELVSGAAYVFVRDGGIWSPRTFVKASNTEALDMFGSSVAISGDTILVGAIQEESAATGVDGDQTDNSAKDAGAAYVMDLPSTPWSNLGGGTVGSAGPPSLVGYGALAGGTPASLTLTKAPPSALMLIWLSFAPVPFPALGGTVHAFPFANQILFAVNTTGRFHGVTTWPLGVPSDLGVWYQVIVADASAQDGLTLSNGVKATTP